MASWKFWIARNEKDSANDSGKPPPHDGWRESLDTVVFVVILVLILKTFVAECFVIPTGSMAETLYGYQKGIVCPECSHSFAVNASDEVENGSRDRNFCTCPNCLRDIEMVRAGQMRRGAEAARVDDPGASTGDRVLVGKFPADLRAMSGPSRNQVVVFKFPGNGGGGFDPFPVSGPQRNHTPMNYIKRCMGLPGEVLGISGGDIYRLEEGWEPPLDEGPFTEWWKADHMRVAYLPKVRIGPEGRLEVPPGDMAIERVEGDPATMIVRGGRFAIVRKPPTVVMAESRLVYDDDKPARDMKAFPRWTGESPASFSKGTDGFYSGDGSGSAAWLRYRHLLRPNVQGVGPAAVCRPQVVTDVMGYNTGRVSEVLFGALLPGEGTRSVAGNWVGDLMVEFSVRARSKSGSLLAEVARGMGRYRARIELSSGEVTLQSIDPDGRENNLVSLPSPVRGGSHTVRFGHVDRTLHLWINGKAVTGEGVPVLPPASSGNRSFDLEPAALGLDGGAIADFGHIKLYRDTYYTAKDSPSEMDVHLDDFAAPLDWSSGKPTPDNLKALSWAPMRVLRVPPGHYLCLGDNSTHSSDSRSWGTVPGRLMLGRAVGVYWPLGRIGLIR
ncbi:MAG: S26 family signal peptidase [Planctomycetota bacterium]